MKKITNTASAPNAGMGQMADQSCVTAPPAPVVAYRSTTNPETNAPTK